MQAFAHRHSEYHEGEKRDLVPAEKEKDEAKQKTKAYTRWISPRSHYGLS